MGALSNSVILWETRCNVVNKCPFWPTVTQWDGFRHDNNIVTAGSEDKTSSLLLKQTSKSVTPQWTTEASTNGSWTSGWCRMCTGQTNRVQSPDGNTFLCEMTSWSSSYKYDVISEIQLRQSMRIHLKNNPAKFHPDPIWNEEQQQRGQQQQIQ